MFIPKMPVWLQKIMLHIQEAEKSGEVQERQ
jgi:hypothetical protein